MSEVGLNADEREPEQHPVEPPSHGAPGADLPGLQPPAHTSQAGVGPSCSAETSGLLSLPWELVTHIASHLPAQCVISVLPKVCQTLGNVGKDSTAWQLRARRLTGSQARFPVGPREDFDWPAACMEMEQLIACWTGHTHLLARQTQGDREEMNHVREQRGEGQDPEPNAEAPEHGEAAEEEGAGVLALEAAYGADEGMEVAIEGEDHEEQLVDGEDQLAILREALEDVGYPVALVEEQRDPREVLDGQEGAAPPQEDLAEPRNQGDGKEAETGPRPARSPSPPPSLECATIQTDHIALVNSVLLVGDAGRVCATASRDGNVKLWDLKAESCGTLLHTFASSRQFNTHQGWVWCLAAQGSLLASGSFDSTVRLWDLQATGEERGLIRTGAAVLCLCFQRDLLLAGTFDKRVSMYDTRAAEPLVKSLRLHGNAVMCLATDENYIVSGSRDCTVAVYDCRADRNLKKIKLKSYLLSMSYRGSEVWGGDNRGMLHSFSMQSGTLKPLSSFDVGHTNLVTGIHRSPGAMYTCSTDRTVKVHIPCAPPRTVVTLERQAGVHGLSVDAGVLAVASGETCVEVWRPRK